MSAWKKTFACAFVAQVLSILGFSFALPFLPFFIGELGIDGASNQAWWSGMILAANGFTLALFAPIWGILADRYGRKPMVTRSMIGGALVLILMSYSQTVGFLFVCRLLQGALSGTVAASVALVASVTPQRRSGFALGMMQAAVLLGLSVGPLAGGIVADTFGYRAAFRVGAVIVVFGGLLVQYGAQENFSVQDTGSISGGGFRSLLTGRSFLIATLILFSVRFSNTIINPSFPLVIRDVLPSLQRLNSITGGIMAAAGLVGAGAAAFLGHIGDRVGYERVVLICCLSAALAAGAHAIARTLPGLAVAHVLFGLSIAGTMPAANTLIQRSIDPKHMGKAFGAASALSLIGIALGPLIGGILAHHLGLRAPFLFAGASQLGVAILAWHVGRPRAPVA